MKESRPKSWDKTKRVYEISYPDGKKEIWKDVTARDSIWQRIKIKRNSGKRITVNKGNG